jgi:hypothetical protein
MYEYEEENLFRSNRAAVRFAHLLQLNSAPLLLALPPIPSHIMPSTKHEAQALPFPRIHAHFPSSPLHS